MSDDKKQPTEEKAPEEQKKDEAPAEEKKETQEEQAPAEKTDAAPENAEKAADAPVEAAEAASADTETPAETETAEAPETPAEDPAEITDEERKAATELPNRDLKPGMVVRVHETIKDTNTKGEERERVQVFEGTILGISGKGIERTMTVRKVSKGHGVEKIYPLSSPHIAKVEVVKQFRTRRAKLGFLRRGKLKRRLRELKK